MRLEEEIKMTTFQSSTHKAVLNALFTGYWLEEQINRMLKPYGISGQQYNILRILRGQKGKALNLFMIQERMLQRMSNVTRLVEKLRLKGLVTRDICPGNRRMVEILITEKGLGLLLEIEKSADGFSMEGKLSSEEAEILSDLLEKLRS